MAMSAGQRPPDARPIFRTLALGVAFVCFILAVVFGSLADQESRLLVVLVCLFVGLVMAVIGLTGYWPPRRKP
jgi:hypothetical protein